MWRSLPEIIKLVYVINSDKHPSLKHHGFNYIINDHWLPVSEFTHNLSISEKFKRSFDFILLVASWLISMEY